MTCIYYQDELGFCCRDGQTWEDFDSNSGCDYRDNMENCPRGITIKRAEEMKEQILFLQATVKAQADLLDKYQSSSRTVKKDED